MKLKFIILLVFISSYSFGQSAETEKIIQAGNDYYKQQQYDLAATEYQKAIEKNPSDNMAKYNLASALYKKREQEEAVKKFTEIANTTKETELKAKSFYNKGAVLSQQKKLEESIDAYKNALRQNPNDKEARENLQKALLELKKKNPPRKQDNKKKQDQQKKKPEPRMSRKEAEQRLKLLEQKEKEVQQRLQKEKSKTGGGQAKDW